MAVFGAVCARILFRRQHHLVITIYMVPVVLMCLTWVMTDDIMSVVFHTLIIACKFLD